LTYINLTRASAGWTTNAACPVRAGTAGWVVLKFKVDASGLVSTGRSINHLVLLGLDMESWLRLRGMAMAFSAAGPPTNDKKKSACPLLGEILGNWDSSNHWIGGHVHNSRGTGWDSGLG